MLGVLNLPLLDGITAEIERVGVVTDPGLRVELERTVDLLSDEWLGSRPESVSRRMRLVEVLRRAAGGTLPERAFDRGDPFGVQMRTMLATDPALATVLGAMFPLVMTARSVAPTSRWVAQAAAQLAGDEQTARRAGSALRRSLAALLRAEIVSRPDLLLGGVRPTNQRIARGMLWLTPVVLESPADLVGEVGLRMGSSGRNDAVVRDAALANTCAALLGAMDGADGGAMLASMHIRVINRNVRKQVDRALEQVAERRGMSVDDVVEASLPSFGLDGRGWLEMPIAGARGVIELTPNGAVTSSWHLPDGTITALAPDAQATADPSGVAEFAAHAAEIGVAVAEERQRTELRMASARGWAEPNWRERFFDHPIGGLFGRRLIWTVTRVDSGRAIDALPMEEGWLAADGTMIPASAGVISLWHPADSSEATLRALRAVLARRSIEQPVEQVERERFAPRAQDIGLAADRRFAGTVVDHRRLRAYLRQRGWAAPFVGTWDQGEEAVAWRSFDGGLRAELLFQAVERLRTGARHDRVRVIAVRFVNAADVAPTTPASKYTSVALSSVPARAYSEAIRDLVSVIAYAPAGHDQRLP